jgi:hypothetical protein
MVMKPEPTEKRGLRKVMSTLSQAQSGRFVQEEYIPQHPERQSTRFHKGGVE